MMREHLTLPPTECRFAADQASGIVSGYAAVFNKLVPSFNEMVRPGAFTRSIAEHRSHGTPIVMLWAHDPSQPIGKWSATEDDYGLKVEGQILTDVVKGREALSLIANKIVNGLSIGFRTRADERGPNGVRVITDAQLEEVSLTAFPAQPGARVTAVRHEAGITAFLAAIQRGINDIRG
jgi:HK97 family phage prohead protease